MTAQQNRSSSISSADRDVNCIGAFVYRRRFPMTLKRVPAQGSEKILAIRKINDHRYCVTVVRAVRKCAYVDERRIVPGWSPLETGLAHELSMSASGPREQCTRFGCSASTGADARRQRQIQFDSDTFNEQRRPLSVMLAPYIQQSFDKGEIFVRGSSSFAGLSMRAGPRLYSALCARPMSSR